MVQAWVLRPQARHRELQVPVGPAGRAWIPHPAEPSAYAIGHA
jgi:hypothetical protein